jgi:hypothetical protein
VRVRAWDGGDALSPFAPRLGLGPGRNLGQGGLDGSLVKTSGDGLSLTAISDGLAADA